MPLHALEPRRLYRQIAEQIRELIASGEFPRGSRLPAERDIASQLGVSRTSVREALIALEIGGFVEVRGGAGIFVTAESGASWPLYDASDAGPGPFELLRARKVVEGEVAALAAAAIDDDGLADLEQTMMALEASGGAYPERDDADRRFHLRIAEATNNSALAQTVRLYWDQRRGPLWRRLVERFHTPELFAAVKADHRVILQALAGHDPAGARAAMRGHLERVEEEFSKGMEGDAAPRILAHPRALAGH